MAALALVSSIWSVQPFFSLERATQFVTAMALALGIYAVFPNNAGQTIGRFLSIGVPLATAVIVLDTVLGYQIIGTLGVDLGPHGYDRALLQLVLLGLVVIAAARFKQSALAILSIGVAVVMTESLATQVGVLVALFIVGLVIARPSTGTYVTAVGALFAILIFPFLLAPAGEFAREALEAQLPESADHRVYIWSYVTERLSETFPFGIGFEASRFGPVIGEVTLSQGSVADLTAPFHAHNMGLQTLYEMGVFGLLLLAGIAWALLVRSWDWPKRVLGPALAVATILIITASLATSAWQAWRIALIGVLLSIFFDLASEKRESRPD